MEFGIDKKELTPTLVIIHVHVHVAADVLHDFIKLTKVNTATAPGQRIAFTRHLFTCRYGHIEMNKNLVQLIYRYKKHETYTRCSFNVNSDSIMGGFCV